ncbi:hypothetical protein ACFLTH_04110 [Bacteroidota bacterium]
MQNISKLVFYCVVFIVLFISKPGDLFSQSFGFGCLGLSGVYGGYSTQTFEAGGLNQTIIARYENMGINNSDVSFGRASGLRLGANIFRAKFSNYFLTFKAFYQFLEEQHRRSHQISSVMYDDNYLLELNHWGVALDLGIPLFDFLDLKIVEGGMIFYNAEFSINSFVDGQNQSEVKYKNSDTETGYYVGTGLIVHIIPDYISLEGTAMYNFVQISRLETGNGDAIPYDTITTNFIESGKVATAVQLNIGFPL